MCLGIILTDIKALPKVKVADVGSTVNLSCDTTDVVQLWRFSSTSYVTKTHTVYEHPNVTYRFMERYSASRSSLTIKHVQLCDAGNYRCSYPSNDDLRTDIIQLIVLGMYCKIIN